MRQLHAAISYHYKLQVLVEMEDNMAARPYNLLSDGTYRQAYTNLVNTACNQGRWAVECVCPLCVCRNNKWRADCAMQAQGRRSTSQHSARLLHPRGVLEDDVVAAQKLQCSTCPCPVSV